MTAISTRIRRPGLAATAVMLSLIVGGALPTVVVAQPSTGGTGAPPVPVLTPSGGIPESTPKVASTPQPVPESGTNQSFSFQKATDAEGTFMIYPSSGGEGVRVSESFLGLVLKSPQLNDEQRAKVLQSYPNMVQKQFESVTNEMYPDASMVGEQRPFSSMAVGTPGSAGGSATIEADPQVPGYLRVSLAAADGSVDEFSVSRQALERILANPSASDADKLNALKNFPFKLPEEARGNFKNLSREQLLELVSQSPEMKRQEFVRMAKYYPKKADGNTTGESQTNTSDQELVTTVVPRASSPAQTPEPTPQADVAPTPGSREPKADSPESTPVPEGARETVTQEGGGLSVGAIAAIVIVVAGLLGALAIGMRKRQ